MWGEAERQGLEQEWPWVHLIAASQMPAAGLSRTWNLAFQNWVCWEEEGQRAWIEIRDAHAKINETFLHLDDSPAEGQDSHRGHVVFILGGFQQTIGQSPEQPGLTSELALLWAGDSWAPFSLTVLRYCHIMKILFIDQKTTDAINKCESRVCVRFCPVRCTRIENQTLKESCF